MKFRVDIPAYVTAYIEADDLVAALAKVKELNCTAFTVEEEGLSEVGTTWTNGECGLPEVGLNDLEVWED